jgi:hypothetical protein
MPGDRGFDVLAEGSSRSWVSRIGGAMIGMVLGLALLPAGSALLFWNEGRVVKTARALAEGAHLVLGVAADRIDPANEGRLVHVSGPLDLGRVPRDPDFDLPSPPGTLRLLRKVEMFQWREEQHSETRNQLGGGTETVTTFRYARAWSEGRIDSGRFRDPEGHENPHPRYSSASWMAEGMRLGGFRLDAAQVGSPGSDEALPARENRLGRISGDALQLGADAASPQVGDLRVSWRILRPDALSVVAAQSGEGFAPYATRSGNRLFMVEAGRVPASDMFRAAEQENELFAWLLRAGGALAILVGWSLLLAPLRVLADVIPLLGEIVGLGAGVLAFMLTLVLAPTMIGLAWLFHRPVLGIAALLASACGMLGVASLRRRGKAARPA